MKILPIILTRNTYYNYPIDSNNTAKISHETNSRNLLNALPNYNIFFTGENEKLNQQLLSLDGIHCPTCGNIMISNKKLREVVKAADEAQNFSEYCRVLEENKSLFKPVFKPIINNFIRLAQMNPELEFENALKILKSRINKFFIQRCANESKYLQSMIESSDFSQNDKKKLNELKDYLLSFERMPKILDIKQKLMNTANSMDSDKKWEIYEKIRDRIFEVYTYNSTLYSENNFVPKISNKAAFVNNLLIKSNSNLVKLFPNTSEKDVKFNNFLICNECNSKYDNFNYIKRVASAEEKFGNYIQDISSAVAENKLTGNSAYIYGFINTLNKVKHFNFKTSSLDGVTKNNIFQESKYKYIFEKYEGIPCAYCGTETLTHEQRLKIYNDIAKSENLNELINITRINQKHITPKIKVLYDRISDILSKNPNITEDELLHELRCLSKEDLRKNFAKIKANLKIQIKDLKNSSDKLLLNTFIYQLDEKYSKLAPDEEFIYDNYDKDITSIFLSMQNPIKRKLIKIAKLNIKDLYLRDCILFPPKNLTEKCGGTFKTIFQHIFKNSVITVDHINPISNGGKDVYFNKIGTCKSCNISKSKIPFVLWLDMHPEIEYNLPKHLKYINKIIKRENLQDMYDYPKNVANYAEKISERKLNIPDNYINLV